MEMNKLILGNCEDVFKDIPDKSINLFLEDMPYNITACKWEYKVDLQEYWKLRLSKLADKGCFVLTATQPFTTDLINSNRKMFKYEWIWQKNTIVNFLHAHKMPLRNYENVLVFYKSQPIYNPQMRQLAHPKTRHGKNFQSTITYKISGKKSENYKPINRNGMGFPLSIIKINAEKEAFNSSNGCQNRHPTQKPVNLFRYLIKTYTNEGDTVFDGYSGSGTTAIACLMENRNYICVEKDKDYFEAASKRIAQHKAQQRLELK